MNVLVYSGPEISSLAINQTVTSLKTILLAHYAVQNINQQALTTQPWRTSCALLVLPRTRDRFVSAVNKHIQGFVESGGSFLMLGSGCTINPRSQGLGLGATILSLGEEESPTNPLRFFDKFSNCHVSFDSEDVSNAAPHVVSLRTADNLVVKGIYSSGKHTFTGFDTVKNATILARCEEDTASTAEQISAAIIDVGLGKIAVWGPSIEYSLLEEPASKSTNLSKEEVQSNESSRLKLLKSTLIQLGLQLTETDEKKPTSARPLPQFLISAPGKPDVVSQILDTIASPSSGSQLSVIKDANDEFNFHPLQESQQLLKSARETSASSADPLTWQPKHVIICPDGILPDRALTPLFDIAAYYKALGEARKKDGLSNAAQPWGIGEALLYGEIVTSTQTMLDKNPLLLTRLPTPILSLASQQLAGRGRGSNIWLSPAGCLQFSLLLRVPLQNFPSAKIVFVQYLCALAVVEACRDDAILGPKTGEKVRLKWPNDLYAAMGPDKEDLRKIGGILVNASFSGGNVDLVIGCGVNILNPPPITSLSQMTQGTLSLEQTAAVIMAKFEPMWNRFLRENGSFEPFMDLYLKRWLHSDQVVTLTTTTPHTKVRVIGITCDHGLLRTIPERSGLRWSGSDAEYIDLQPDGNSFDQMANLIKMKS